MTEVATMATTAALAMPKPGTVRTYSTDASTVLERIFSLAQQEGTTNGDPEYVPLRSRRLPNSFWCQHHTHGAATATGLVAAGGSRITYTVKKGKLFAGPDAAALDNTGVLRPLASSFRPADQPVKTKANPNIDLTPNRPEKPKSGRKGSVSGKFSSADKQPKAPKKTAADAGASKEGAKRRKSTGGRKTPNKNLSKMHKLIASTKRDELDVGAAAANVATTATGRSSWGGPSQQMQSRFIDIRGLSPASSEDSRAAESPHVVGYDWDCSMAELGCVSPLVSPAPPATASPCHIAQPQRSLSCPPMQSAGYEPAHHGPMDGLVDDFDVAQEFKFTPGTNMGMHRDGARSMFELTGQESIAMLSTIDDPSLALFSREPDHGAMSPDHEFMFASAPAVGFTQQLHCPVPRTEPVRMDMA